jgi:hypothetical protein
MAPRVNWNGYFRFVDGRLSNCLFTQLFTHRKINLQSPRSKGSIEAGYLSSIEYLVLNNKSICLWRAML